MRHKPAVGLGGFGREEFSRLIDRYSCSASAASSSSSKTPPPATPHSRGAGQQRVHSCIHALRAADNEYAKLLAIRNGAEALEPCNDPDAIDQISCIAIDIHGLDPDDVRTAIAFGFELGRLTRTRAPSFTERTTLGSTIEALMYALRTNGLGCLANSANCDRLHRCDAAALEQIVQRLLDLDWTTESVEELIAARAVLP
jgi:hypothetical protein